MSRNQRLFIRQHSYCGGSDPMFPVNDPLTLPGLELYLRSDQVAGADGSQIAAWTNNRWDDLSGNGRHATLGLHSSPVLRKTGAHLTPGGKQVVQWGAATDGLVSFMGALPISGANGWTFLAYYKSVAFSAGHNNDLCTAAVGSGMEWCGQSNIAFNGYDRNGRLGFDCTGVVRKTFDPLSSLGWHLASVTLSPPLGAGALAGTLDAADLTPTFSGWTVALENNLDIGNNAGSNSDLEGCLAALLVYSRPYTGRTLAGLKNFLHLFFD